jgi:hypothetical protein
MRHDRKRKLRVAAADVAAFAGLLALGSSAAQAHIPIRKVVLTDQVAESARWKAQPHTGAWGKGTLRSHQPYPYDQRFWNTR